MKYIPLANLKNTTGIVAFCKDAKEIVIANRNGLPKLVLMSREVYENGLGRLADRVLLNVHRDMELVAEPVLIRTFNNPAEIVRICEKEIGKVVPVLRNGDYVLSAKKDDTAVYFSHAGTLERAE